MSQGKFKKLITKRANKGIKEYPLATIAFYGPDDKSSTKVVCGIFKHKDSDVEPMKKWFSKNDLRKSEKILSEILAFMDENKVKSVGMIEDIIGCPHEEGIDYPDGESCPKCSFWQGRDRFTHEKIH